MEAIDPVGRSSLVSELDVPERDYSRTLNERVVLDMQTVESYLDTVLSGCRPKEIAVWGLSQTTIQPRKSRRASNTRAFT